ncbi:MAG TPA: AAA family ATPase [Ktedonobacterales bacterium]|jgi:hypothetical protein|nr:AAA family ATPase [Ktedonobacterales bacterium]
MRNPNHPFTQREAHDTAKSAYTGRPLDIPFDLPCDANGNGNNGHGHAVSDGKFDWRAKQINGEQLRTKVITHKPYLVPQYIPHGFTLLGGRPKAGKTTLAMQVGYQVATLGGSVLGQQLVVHGDVHLVGLEDTQARYQHRFQQMFPNDAYWPERFHLHLEWPTMAQGGLEYLGELLAAYPETVAILIDSWPLFRGVSESAGYNKDYADSNAMATWTREHDTNVLVTTHTTKTKTQIDGEEIDFIQDTTGITAGADTILVMKRVAGVMTLFRRGRDLDDNDPVKLQDDAETLLWMPGVTAPPSTRQSILCALVNAGADGLTPAGVAQVSGIKRETCKQMLHRLCTQEHLVEAGESGVYTLTPEGISAVAAGSGV